MAMHVLFAQSSQETVLTSAFNMACKCHLHTACNGLMYKMPAGIAVAFLNS